MPKRERVSSLVISSNSSMLLLTETWLTNDITDAEVIADLPNFSVYRKDRTDSRGGGVLIAAGPELSCSPIRLPSNLEILWLLCRTSPHSVIIGVCYRPPHSSPNFSRELNNMLNQLMISYPNAHILLFGDFNYPGINWLNRSHSQPISAESRDFLDVCLNFNLYQLVTSPTRTAGDSSNILDLILSSHPDSLSSITYLEPISDHKVIQADFSFRTERHETQKKTITLYDKGNYNAINHELSIFSHSSKPVITRDLLTRIG